MAIFLSLSFLLIWKLVLPSNKQTFAKIDFEISAQRTYLKKWVLEMRQG